MINGKMGFVLNFALVIKNERNGQDQKQQVSATA